MALRTTRHVDTPESIIAYYTAASHVFGIDREKLEQEGVWRQAGFSLEWFFRYLNDDPQRIEELSPVAQAFLGAPGAQDAMRRTEGLPLDDTHLLESDFSLNGRQRLAVERALREPISLVQGPPGTGKTETILNMASCIIGAGATVAVVSNNREALGNIETKIKEDFLDLDEAQRALRPNWARLASAYARIGNKEARRAWNKNHPEEAVFTVGSPDDEGDVFWNKTYRTSGWEPRVRARDFLSDHPFVTSTIHSLMKTFSDGGTHLYDYVIMDEASQCSVMLGLLALSRARHVVLVGDDEQLAPIYPDDRKIERELERQYRYVHAEPPLSAPYRLRAAGAQDGTSILDAARDVLGPLGAPSTMLNEHFRCHPGIIGFCNDHIYRAANPADPLVIKTPVYDDSVACPIRVRWFEGNYCESVTPGAEPSPIAPTKDAADRGPAGDADDGDGVEGGRVRRTGSKRNRKQLEIFMREEWPELSRRLARDPDLSICILSPYTGQLEELRRMLEAAGAGEGLSEERGREGAADPLSAQGPESLTIHKAQGQQFDIVYLLPVEDGRWKWPWSQGRRLINVAVSRARRELVVIASTRLMSPALQRELTGHVLSDGSARPADNPETVAGARERQELYVQKLVDYAHDRGKARRENDPQARFGLHRTRLSSVFDAIPRVIDECRSASGAPIDRTPEVLVGRMIARIVMSTPGLAYASDVRIDRCWPREMLDWNLADDGFATARQKLRFATNKDKGRESHFDFVIGEKRTGRILLAIEVDGAGHRAMRNDGRRVEEAKRDTPEKLRHRIWCQTCKDAIVRDMGGVVLQGNIRTDRATLRDPSFVLLRLPSDGTTAFECEALRRGDRIEGHWMTIEEIVAERRSSAAEMPQLSAGRDR